MELTIDAGLSAMLLAAAFALACGLEARSRAEGTPSSRSFPIWLAVVALLAGLNHFVLGRHPTQLVKTWDVQHAVLGAKYARELGYFRIYECIVVFDAEGPRRLRGLAEVSDLREPRSRVAPRTRVADSDCADRFSAERRAAFETDLAFFAGLPRQPDPATWYTDNGYNQSPFYTALLAPLLARTELSGGLVRALVLIDPILEVSALALVIRCFGAPAGLLLAVYFFTNFSNQFALMGGAILRYAYLSLLLAAACGMRTGRFRAAGAALGVASLLQVFPALYAVGLGVWAGLRAVRRAERPEWLLPGAIGFGAATILGLAWSTWSVGAGAWPEFVAKMAIHSGQLSEYRVGLKLPFVLGWPVPSGGALDWSQALDTLEARFAWFAGTAALLLGACLLLARRLSALAFALGFGTLALYVLTPVHYYWASLALLFLVDGEGDEPSTAGSLGRALLFALSAGAWWLWRSSDGALAAVNAWWLSPGLGAVLVVLGAALYRGGARQESPEARSA